MAYRRTTRTTRGAGKSGGYSRSSSSRRAPARKAAPRARRASGGRSSAAPRQQTLRLVIEHAAPNAVARPAEERPVGDGTVITRPTKSKF
jgi:hypothetical protein